MKKENDKRFGKEASMQSVKDPQNNTKYSPLEFYQLLLPLEMGKPIKESELDKAREMKEFLSKEFNTDKIHQINEEDLKKKINGEHMIDRLKYRK